VPLRLIEIIVPKVSADAIAGLPSAQDVVDRWDTHLGEDKVSVRMLVDAQRTETMLDDMQNRFSDVDGFRVILLPVEATLPRPPENSGSGTKKSPERISREELYNDVVHSAQITRVFVAQVIIATLVAAVGLMRDDTAVIIGAMVIAPLLGPNVSLCLATALGDAELAVRSLKTNLMGLSVAFGASLLIGSIFQIDPSNESINSRTHVSAGDIILALAAGCAGVLAFTSGAPSALIGVMVAVALLPPFAVFGLLLASGELSAARGALLLVATNVICVNLSGVLTFAAQGLRPRTWWEADRAKTATRIAVLTWSLLLVVLLVLMLLVVRP
jgi:uncharacterized hydrophobic protein (TIGR00341 family)